MGPITVENQLEIRRPVGDVFSFVCDHEHLPAWTVGVKRATRTSTGPIGVGTTYSVVGRMLGRRVRSTYEVTAYEPDTLFSGRMTSPSFSFEETYRFETDGEGRTMVRVHVEARPGRALRLLGPLLVLAMNRQVQADHRRLRTVLERSGRARARAGRTAAADQHQGAEPSRERHAGEGDPGQ